MSKTMAEVIHQHCYDNDLNLNGDTRGEATFLARELEAAGFGKACELPHETVKQRQNREKLQMQMRQIREVLELKITDAPDDLKWAVSRIEKIIAWGEDEL